MKTRQAESLGNDAQPAAGGERILFALKSAGRQTAAALGERLDMTAIGARQHLVKLQAAGLVDAAFERQPRGRPRKLWRLTERGHGRFPDRHADLTLDLLRSTEAVFGAEGVDKLIRHRERAMRAKYMAATGAKKSLRAKVAALAALRDSEGYMASVEDLGRGAYRLIEDHCPVCAAASACQGLCRSELRLFRAALGKGVKVERVDHLLAGARRCAYRIEPA